MPRVLIVDDDPAFLELLSNELNYYGYSATKATNGSDAIDIYKEIDFDLVITDFQMPGINGLVVAHEIRQICFSQNRKLVNIILLSSECPDKIKVQMESSNDIDFIAPKLFGLEALKVYIKNSRYS